MQSSLISKIEKARRYAGEPERVSISDFSATFRGDHDSYRVRCKEGTWDCTCHFFETWKTCSHTMALQRILNGMLPKETLASTAP